MRQIADIFISYAREDREKIAPLAKALENQGWSVWWDPEIRSGKRFDSAIQEALEDARSVLVVWSHHSVDSEWVSIEANEGLQRDILISVAIEPNVKPPLRFRYIQTEQLIDWDDKSPSLSFNKILADFKAILGKSDHFALGSMVKVPPGEFIYQAKKVTIEKPFMMDVYPVTNSQFGKFIEAGGYTNPQYWSNKGKGWMKESEATAPKLWDDDEWNQPQLPVVGVNFYEAQAYAKWSGKRLPTEMEWERAARGTEGQEYPWGNVFDPERCNTVESHIGCTTPVMSYLKGASLLGCCDMAGNVWEWCQEGWFEKSKFMKVLRGGSWLTNQILARCVMRLMISPTYQNSFVGFRCARDVE